MDVSLSAVATPLEGRPLEAVVAAVLGGRATLSPGTPDNLLLPAKGLWAVSADGRAWLFCATMFDDFVSRRINPQRQMAGFTLHGATGAYGFALWRDGAFVRRRFGATPTGALAKSVIFDDGDVLPEEIAAVHARGTAHPDVASAEIAEAIWREPRIIEEPVDHAAFGVPVVLAMLRALDGADDAAAVLASLATAPAFEVKRVGLLSRLLGRA